jgi:hypothetical protein
MAGGTGVMLGLGEAGEDGAEVGVEGGVEGGLELAVGCTVADAMLLGLTVMLQPPSVTSTTTQAAATRTRWTDLASGTRFSSMASTVQLQQSCRAQQASGVLASGNAPWERLT